MVVFFARRLEEQLTASQGILEDLLKTKEFQNRHVHCRVESQATLVRAQGGVELDTIAPVDFHLNCAITVSPSALRLARSIETTVPLPCHFPM